MTTFTGKFNLMEGQLFGGYIVNFKNVEVTATDRNLIWTFTALTDPSTQLMFSAYLPHQTVLHAKPNDEFYMNGYHGVTYIGRDSIILKPHGSNNRVVFVRE
ncbi:MAG: hypothetical protein GWP27_11205 [Bacteroidetes bacterium]|nr:hypothetical protein [Bacteroidota bacterium]